MDITRPEWLPPEQFPFSLRQITLAENSVTYVDEGDGPTLLFVHAGMWSFVFRDAIERLRGDFRCVALDFPGYGLSPRAGGDLGVGDMADLVEGFVKALDLDDYTLVVHDLGGPVGLVAAARDPERVAGLVISQSFAWTPDRAALRAMFRIVGSRPFTALDRATNLVPRMTAGKSGVGKHLDAAGRRAFLGPFRDRDVRRRFHTTMRSAFRDRDLTEAAERAATGTFRHRPTLTIFGEKNDPFGFQERHAEVFADHEGVVVKGGNHFPMMDDPDLFADSLREWHGRSVGPYRSGAAGSIGQPTSVR